MPGEYVYFTIALPSRASNLNDCRGIDSLEPPTRAKRRLEYALSKQALLLPQNVKQGKASTADVTLWTVELELIYVQQRKKVKFFATRIP